MKWKPWWSIIELVLCVILLVGVSIFHEHYKRKWERQDRQNQEKCEARGYTWYESACVEFK